jgi:hypothetical protein
VAVGKGKERTFGGRIMDITDEALALEHEMNAMIDPGMDVCLACGCPLNFTPTSEDGGFCCVECEDYWIETCGQGERYDEEADKEE